MWSRDILGFVGGGKSPKDCLLFVSHPVEVKGKGVRAVRESERAETKNLRTLKKSKANDTRLLYWTLAGAVLGAMTTVINNKSKEN